MPDFFEIEETFCGRTYGRAGGHLMRPTLLGQLAGVDLNISPVHESLSTFRN